MLIEKEQHKYKNVNYIKIMKIILFDESCSVFLMSCTLDNNVNTCLAKAFR